MLNTPNRQFQEVFTGYVRPRHLRFSNSLQRLFNTNNIVVSDAEWQGSRIKTALNCRVFGYRALKLPDTGNIYLIHQALNLGDTPYVAEFDMPLALHNYNVKRHRKAFLRVRNLMERENLRTLLVFSEWSRRSFEMHYGKEIGAKCRVVYPLAAPQATNPPFEERQYDFCFISTPNQFRIKGGPEAVQAFQRVRSRLGNGIRLCIVANLPEANKALGNLDDYPGVEWRQSNLSQIEIAKLLGNSRCLVHPSMSDSFGVVILEALAAGCAIITSNFGSIPEMVEDNVNGFLINMPVSAVIGDTYITEYGDASYLSRYINTLSLHSVIEELDVIMGNMVENESAAKLMMARSGDLYRSRFSEEIWMQSMANILQSAFPEYDLLNKVLNMKRG